MNKELERLFAEQDFNRPDWLIGKIPKHYKRISVPYSEALQLAKLGAVEMGAYFDCKLFFSQALIAGAILSGRYDEFVIVSPSQYGKSWLLGRLGLLLAYRGHKLYLAGAAANVTDIIMSQVISAVQEATPELQNALLDWSNKLERLSTSVSKSKLAFREGGFIEPITLGDTYSNNITANKAVGRGGDFFVDEAANVSDNSIAEMGRREFANVNGEKYLSVMISNPHKPGVFYDKLIDEHPPENRFILWMDALTAVEEERFTKKQVAESEFAKHTSTRRRYLLCELDISGNPMFDVPKTYQAPYQGDYVQYFLGVDAAYKGKDNIEVCLMAVSDDGMCHVEDITTIKKTDWIDGKTSKDIIDQIKRWAYEFHVALICVDIGFGVWLVEGLSQEGLPVLGINFGSAPTKARVRAKHYSAMEAQNMRAEMHLDLQNLIEDGHIEISEDAYAKIKDCLPFITAERKASGKIQIRPKAEIKVQIGRSPDELDSMLLAIHSAIVFGGESLTFM